MASYIDDDELAGLDDGVSGGQFGFGRALNDLWNIEAYLMAELDEDSDGVVDRLDNCPGTAAGVQVDVKGCEIRQRIDLPGVTFETNSDRLLPGAESVLNRAWTKAA